MSMGEHNERPIIMCALPSETHALSPFHYLSLISIQRLVCDETFSHHSLRRVSLLNFDDKDECMPAPHFSCLEIDNAWVYGASGMKESLHVQANEQPYTPHGVQC